MDTDVPMDKTKLTLLIVSMVFWGLSFPAIKVSLNEVQPLTLGLLRSVFGVIPLSIFMILRIGHKNVIKKLRSDLLPFIAIGLTQFYLPLTSQNVGMGMMAPESAASVSSILQATAPIFVLFFSSMFLDEYIGKKKAVGAALALSGSFLLVTKGGMIIDMSNLVGNSLLLASAIFYAVSGVITKKALADHEPIFILSFALMFSSIFFLPTALVTENISHLSAVSSSTWIIVLFLGFVCNGLALLIWYVVLVESQLSKQFLFTYLIPLFGIIFSHLFLGEMIELTTVIFGLLIIVGITIAQYGKEED